MKIRWFVVLGLGAACAVGCGSKEGSSPAGSSTSQAAGGTAGSPTAKGGGASSAGPVNGCAAFDDHTDESAERKITWDESVARSKTRCMKIKAGEAVTWEGDFARYPLQASGGAAASPLAKFREAISNPGVKGEERANVEFKTPGTYGYANPSKPEMKGAIQVVP